MPQCPREQPGLGRAALFQVVWLQPQLRGPPGASGSSALGEELEERRLHPAVLGSRQLHEFPQPRPQPTAADQEAPVHVGARQLLPAGRRSPPGLGHPLLLRPRGVRLHGRGGLSPPGLCPQERPLGRPGQAGGHGRRRETHGLRRHRGQVQGAERGLLSRQHADSRQACPVRGTLQHLHGPPGDPPAHLLRLPEPPVGQAPGLPRLGRGKKVPGSVLSFSTGTRDGPNPA